jgi:hypothetical protein
MKTLLTGAVLVMLAACAPPATTTVSMSWGPGPWYHYCTWDAPCWYSEHQVFVYGWGYIERPQYAYLVAHPERRDTWANRRREWYPEKRPVYRGHDWEAYQHSQQTKHEERDDHRHHEDHEH